MITCLVSEVECLGYSEHNGVGFLFASTAEHKTVEPEEQRGKTGGGREGERERGQKDGDGGDVITGVPFMCVLQVMFPSKALQFGTPHYAKLYLYSSQGNIQITTTTFLSLLGSPLSLQL